MKWQSRSRPADRTLHLRVSSPVLSVIELGREAARLIRRAQGQRMNAATAAHSLARRCVGALVFCALLGGTPLWAQEHRDVVERVRRELTAKGLIPAGIVNPGNNERPCGVFEITKRVAWELRAEGAGLLSKPSGNNCNGYSMDWVVYPDGRGSDIAVGGEFDGVTTDAAPAWSIEVIEDHGKRWRPPIDPEDAPPPPPLPNPGTNPPTQGTPPVPPIDLSGLATKEDVLRIEAKLDVHEAREAAFREAVASRWARIAKFVGKYGSIIGGAVAATWLGKPNDQ